MGSEAAPLFDTALAAPAVSFPRRIGQAKFTLKLERKHKDFKAGVTMLLSGLPGGFQAAVKADKDNYNVTLTGPKDAAEGRVTWRLVSYGELGGRGQIVARDIPIDIVEPLAATIAPAGPLAAGKTQKARISLVRKGDDKQPVTVKFTKLPAGVTADESYTIAADQHEIEVELTAAADAAVGKFEALTVEAASKYAGQDLSVTSAPAVLEVVKE